MRQALEKKTALFLIFNWRKKSPKSHNGSNVFKQNMLNTSASKEQVTKKNTTTMERLPTGIPQQHPLLISYRKRKQTINKFPTKGGTTNDLNNLQQVSKFFVHATCCIEAMRKEDVNNSSMNQDPV